MAGAYTLGGITLLSELALPELISVQHGVATREPVIIRIGEVPDVLPGAVAIDAYCFATPDQYLLHIDGIARYLVSQGREVIVSPAANALELDVRAYLLSTVFVVLCQQRALLPLHASAVLGRAGVVAFLANSGHGKSSLAAHLAARGYPVVADDICLLDPSQSGEMMVAPTAPWLKLWRASLENLGRSTDALARVFSEDDKFRLPLAGVPEEHPLRALVFLDRGSPSPGVSPGVSMDPISPFAAVPRLMDLTHQAYVLQATGQREENFRRCSRVSSHAGAFRLVRPWGLEHLEATADALEEMLR